METKIREDLREAQLLRNEITVQTLRMLLSEVKNAEIAKGEVLSDEEVISVVQKELKKRKEAVEAFRAGNREELAQKEEAEAAVLNQYLPEQLSEGALTEIVDSVIAETGASTMQDMGKVIGMVRAKVGQKAEGSMISQIVKSKLS